MFSYRIQSKNAPEEKPAKFLRFKHQLLLNYLTNVSFYLVLKASGVPDIQNHPVIHALVELRSTLEKTEQVEIKLLSEINDFMDQLDQSSSTKQQQQQQKKSAIEEEEQLLSLSTPNKKKSSKKSVSFQSQLDQQEEETVPQFSDDEEEEEEEEEQPTAFDIEEEFKSLKKANKKRKRTNKVDDFGELEALDELDMQDKLARKRSIRDYVTKIDAVSVPFFFSKKKKNIGDNLLLYMRQISKEKYFLCIMVRYDGRKKKTNIIDLCYPTETS